MQPNTKDTYLRRFLAALPAAAALVLTLLFFTPVETVMLNASSFKFSARTAVMPVMAAVSLPLVAVLAALLAAFRGKAHEALVTACMALGLCLYVQGTFLAGSTPPLNGDSVEWSTMRHELIINTAIWLAMFAVPFVLLHFRAVWKHAKVLLPLVMIVMQLTGIVSGLLQPEDTSYTSGYLSTEQMTEYSTKGNTLVFMLDRMDYNNIEAILKDDPTFFDRLDGFTRYDNAISQHAHTRPGMNFILTGYDDTLYQEDVEDFFRHTWDSGDRHLLQDLKSAGYTVDLYGVIRSILGTDYPQFQKYVSNLQLGKGVVDNKKLVVRMTALSCYKNLPLAMKPFFRESNTWFNGVVSKSNGYSTNARKYNSAMKKGMTVTGNTKFFKFFEFSGAHEPYHMKADGTYSKKTTDVVTQSKGCFEILIRAFDKLKEAGAYKDTAIIITADHGNMYDDFVPLQAPTRICMFYKPAGVEGTPCDSTYAPVSLRNVAPTIIKEAGLDYSAYGVPLDEVPDDETIVRDHTHTIASRDVGWIDYKALHYEVLYDASKMESWILKDEELIEHPIGF